MIENALRQIGMTEGETRVYLSLIKLGKTTTGDVIKDSSITSSKVYLILERLEQKGLVSHVVLNNIKYFEATDPSRLLDYMAEKQQQLKQDYEMIQHIVPQLQAWHSKHDEYEATMFSSVRGFLSARNQFVNDLKAGDEYVVFASTASLGGAFAARIQAINEDNDKRGVRTRVLLHKTLKRAGSVYNGYKLVQVRYTEIPVPSATAVSSTKVLHMTYGSTPTQILITNKELVTSYRTFFEYVWKSAKSTN